MASFWQIEKELHDCITCLHQATAGLRRVYGLHPGDRQRLLDQVMQVRRLAETCLGQVGDITDPPHRPRPLREERS
jgi:hypothetical protein